LSAYRRKESNISREIELDRNKQFRKRSQVPAKEAEFGGQSQRKTVMRGNHASFGGCALRYSTIKAWEWRETYITEGRKRSKGSVSWRRGRRGLRSREIRTHHHISKKIDWSPVKRVNDLERRL
jgi:hypothetical protein